jgi:hypothetical protein
MIAVARLSAYPKFDLKAQRNFGICAQNPVGPLPPTIRKFQIIPLVSKKPCLLAGLFSMSLMILKYGFSKELRLIFTLQWMIMDDNGRS